jgi:citrate lyase beta subunit
MNRKSSKKADRSPVHVVYGGADRFSAATPRKLGDIALSTINEYAPNFCDFARAFDLSGCDRLPADPESISKLEKQIARNQTRSRIENFEAWFAWTVHGKSIKKLQQEPVEDFRIDFEDGYGFRPDSVEDRDTIRAAGELADAYMNGTNTPFCGFRIKSLNTETHTRAIRTLDLFLETLVDRCGGSIPGNFVVTVPKVVDKNQVVEICDRVVRFEKKKGLQQGLIGIELMIETPQSIFDETGQVALWSLVGSADGRCTSVHFGAYDYTSALGIVSTHQHLNHPACDFARQVMLANLGPLGLRLSDSVTAKMPVAIHKKGKLSKLQIAENRSSILDGWREHFANVTRSMQNGFFQSWDLHPNQLVARYAALFAFFIESQRSMAERLSANFAKATQATLTGNTFDDAASAEGILNFFRKGLNCGAFEPAEIKKMIGFSANDLCTMSFAQLADASSGT